MMHMRFGATRSGLWFGAMAWTLSSLATAQTASSGGAPQVTVGDLASEGDTAGGLGSVRVQGGTVVLGAGGESARVLNVGCTARSAVVQGTLLFVACDNGVVRTYAQGANGALTVVSERRVGAEVRGLFVQGGRVWVEYARVEAQPVENLGAVQAPGLAMAGSVGPAGPQGTQHAGIAADVSQAHGEVLEVHGTQVVISLGRAEGLHGDNAVEIGGRSGEDGNEIPATVVGRVRDVSAGRAVVDIGFGESVNVGDRVRQTTRATTDSRVAPPRSGGIIEAGASVRALIPIGAIGIGALTDIWATWHANIPFALRARFFPVGGLYADAGSGYGGGPSTGGVFGAALEAMFDSQFFAIGLGLGAAQYSQYSSAGSYGFAVTQVLRVGALDGFNFYAQNQIIVANGQFQYGGTEGRFQIPLTRTWWLIIQGGGSVAPFAYTDVGMRIATQGNGRGGTLFVTPTIGFAGLPVANNSMYGYGSSFRAGPTVGIGLEYRFGL